MTISAETFRRVEYTGSGSTGPFTLGFSIDDDDELTVVKTLISTGASTALVKTTDYTVASDLTSITLVSSISSLYRLTILGNTPMTQEIEYIDFTKMPAENTEDGLDKLTKIIIEQQEMLSRTVLLDPGSTAENIALPNPDAGLFLRWNSGETALENYDVIPAGSTTQIQYNNAGVFAGDTGFTTNGSGSVNISGDLDVDNLNLNGNTIISTNSNGNIAVTPNGTGSIVLDGLSWPQADGTAGYFLKTDGAAQLSFSAVYTPGGTDVAIADGGTGASTAAAARASLGLEIGVDVQAYSGNLTALVNLVGDSDNLIYFSSPTGLSISPLTSYARTLIDDATAGDARTTLGLGSIATQASSSVSITGGSISGITDLAIADGGTGASSAADARTNLGLVIGTNVQAYDAQLADIAGLIPTDNGVIIGNGANFVVESGATLKTSLGLTIGTDVQAYSSALDAVSGTNTGDQSVFNTIAVAGQSDVVADSTGDTLTLVAGTNITITTVAGTDSITINSTATGISDGDKGDITVSGSGATWTIDSSAVTYAKIQNVSATDKILGRSTAGAGVIEEIACTAAGRAILDDADASAQRTTLGLAIGTNVQAYDADLTDLATRWIPASAASAASLTLLEDTDSGSHSVTVSAPASLAASYTFTLPDSGGTINYVLKTDGAGTTSWVAQSAAISDGDKGDITVSASGATWTIDAGVVTLAKMADMATDSFLGRDTAGTGAPEVLSVATTKTLLGLTGTNSGDQSIFQTISVSGQSDVVADSTSDTLTLAAGSNITITTNAGTDTITIAASGGGTPAGSDTQVQFNDGGSFGGDSGLVFNKTTNNLTALGTVTSTGTNLIQGTGAVSGGLSLGDVDNSRAITLKAHDTMTATYQLVFPAGTAAANQVLKATDTGVNLAWSDVYYPSGTDVAVADGGTGASDASTARTNLGLAIGTNVQAYSADLTDLVTQWTPASASGAASLIFLEDTDNGTDKVTLAGPASVTASYTFTLPSTGGTADYVLKTNGSGTTSWVAQSGGSTNLGLITAIAKGLF